MRNLIPSMFDEQVQDIGSRIIGGENTMGSRVVGEPHRRRESQGTMTVPRAASAPVQESSEQIRRERDDAKRHSEFLKQQPKVAVPLIDNRGGLTLAAALERIESHGGLVLAGEHNTLRFLLPLRLHESPNADRVIRRNLHEAIEVLDNCRGLVHALLKAKKALPDLAPALGGGVVA